MTWQEFNNTQQALELYDQLRVEVGKYPRLEIADIQVAEEEDAFQILSSEGMHCVAVWNQSFGFFKWIHWKTTNT